MVLINALSQNVRLLLTMKEMSFSQFGVLMSTLNCEKDSLLGQIILVQKLQNILSGQPLRTKCRILASHLFGTFHFLLFFKIHDTEPFLFFGKELKPETQASECGSRDVL